MDFENQQMLENLFNQRQQRPLLLKYFSEHPAAVKAIAAAVHGTNGQMTKEFCLDLLIHMAVAKRATVPTLVGVLKFHFASQPDPYQVTANALLAAALYGLIRYDRPREQLVVVHEASQDVHALIQQYMYLPPMIVPPLKIEDNGRNAGSGYITKRDDSLLLKDNHHDGNLCLDHLNRVNQVALTINVEVVKGIRNHWKGVDKCGADETIEEYRDRLHAFEKFERDSFNVIALMVEMGNEFYLTHKYDKRGRSYCQGYHINYQGNTWQKACVELAHKELVSEEIQ